MEWVLGKDTGIAALRVRTASLCPEADGGQALPSSCCPTGLGGACSPPALLRPSKCPYLILKSSHARGQKAVRE